MTQSEFQSQIARLAETFGKNHYGTERVRMLWTEIQAFSRAWLARTVDGFISTSRYAPLPAEFSEAISIERERLWKIEKEQHARDAKRFMQSKFSIDDERMIIQGIVRRLTRQMPDSDWETFRTFLTNAASDAVPYSCYRCQDTGLVWARSKDDPMLQYLFKCQCRWARSDSRKYPLWTREYESEWEIVA